MFADIMGFTALGQVAEPSALEMLDKAQNILAPIVSKHRGRVVKTMGDGFLMEFGSALEATLCAVDIQSSVHSMRLERGERLLMRIGIHLGDVVLRGEDILGDAVNVASRIEPLAEPGGICMSEQVYDQIRNKVPYRLTKLRPKSLKNVKTTMDTYKVELPWEAGESSRVLSSGHESIAVMPFVNISPDRNDEYFADGMTEELIARLSLLKGLDVTARTSVMNYKKKEKSAIEIGRELGVGTLLEGSVRKAGNRIRVTVQLIDADTEGHLWAESYDGDLGDIFQVQASIAEKVADSLQVRMLGEEKKAIEGRSTALPQAYVEYLRGLQFFHRLDDVWVRKAIERFEKSLRLDPKYAAAAAQLSMCYFRLGYIRIESGDKVYPRAKSLALRALGLDERVAEGHLAMALVMSNVEADWARAETEFRRCLELNPSLVDAHLEYGRFLCNMGRSSEAIMETRKALELDPVSFVSELRVGGILEFAGRKAEGLSHLAKAVEMEPSSPIAHGIFGHALHWNGRVTEGLKESERGYQLGKSPMMLETLGRALARAGKKREALQVAEKIRRYSKRLPVAYELAIVYAAVGQKQEALDQLERAYEQHAVIYTPLFTVDEVFDGLHKERRFHALAQKLGLQVK